MAANKGVMPKNEREWLLDNNSVTDVSFTGNNLWIQLAINTKNNPPDVTKISLNGSLQFTGAGKGGWQFSCWGSNDGLNWNEIGNSTGAGLLGADNPTEPATGTLSGKYGDVAFSQDVTLEGASSKVIALAPANVPGLHIKNPKLWWPKGYGNQNLYDVQLSFGNTDGVSDKKEFNSGIREMPSQN